MEASFAIDRLFKDKSANQEDGSLFSSAKNHLDTGSPLTATEASFVIDIVKPANNHKILLFQR